MAVKDYSTNPDENTTISDINIAEGCPPSGINNAIRQVMADVKEEYDTQAETNKALATTVMTGASSDVAGKVGLVPEPAAGKQNSFLRGDGTWAVAAGLPLGHFFTWPFSTPPDGSIIVNGATYSRSLYADLWAYVSSHADWVKTESEWQSIASANGGYCPYYSSGDGSTTFRVPKFAPYQQLAISSANAGTYHQAGLPEIGGTFQAFASANATGTGIYHQVVSSSAPRYNSGRIADGTGGEVFSDVIVNASPVYGRSDTVTPEFNEWIVCVVAYGSATNVGNVDVVSVMAAVNMVQAKAEEAVEIDSSGYSSSQHWVRYKDGRQIIYSDWGNNFSENKTISFVKSFTTTPALIGFDNEVHPSNLQWERKFSHIEATYFTIYDWAYGSTSKSGCWVAFGTWK